MSATGKPSPQPQFLLIVHSTVCVEYLLWARNRWIFKPDRALTCGHFFCLEPTSSQLFGGCNQTTNITSRLGG